MAESSLAASWDELRQRVAFSRGWSTDPAAWDDQQRDILEMVLRSGARLFYKPRPVGGPPHEWTFLKPLFPGEGLVLPSGEEEVALPADFGFLVGDLYFVDPTVSYARPLARKNDGKLLQLRQSNSPTSGQPEFCAIVPSTKPGALKGQRSKLLLWPTPNQEYTVQGRYSVLPEALDITNPYPYGGAAHAETLIQACLAASEQLNNTPGPAAVHFAECLASSIEYDRRVAAQSIDNEDGFYRRREPGWPQAAMGTYNGLYS